MCKETVIMLALLSLLAVLVLAPACASANSATL